MWLSSFLMGYKSAGGSTMSWRRPILLISVHRAASVNSWREFLTSAGFRKMTGRQSHGHRTMSQPMWTKMLPWDQAAPGRWPAGARRASVRKLADSRKGILRWGTNHTIIRSSGIIGRTPSLVPIITVQCPTWKFILPSLVLCEYFTTFKMKVWHISLQIHHNSFTNH